MDEYYKHDYDRSYIDEDGEYMCFDYDEDPEIEEERMNNWYEYKYSSWEKQLESERELHPFGSFDI